MNGAKRLLRRYPEAGPARRQWRVRNGNEPDRSPEEDDAQVPSHRRRWRHHPVSSEAARAPADFLRLADLLAPASLVETRDCLRIDEEYVRGLAVVAFPREVSSGGWLAPQAP